MFTVIGTDTYLKEISKWPKDYQEIASKIPTKLKENPLLGKQLTYTFLRESKIKERRVYYLIYEDFKLILLVATSGKKDQQKTINHIKRNFDEFRKVAKDISRQVS